MEIILIAIGALALTMVGMGVIGWWENIR